MTASRRLLWYHPEWTVALVAVAAWAVLIVVHGDAASPHHHTGTAPAWHATAPTGSPYLMHWVAMSAAMMLPALLPMVRAVGLSSRWSRRQRAQAVYVGSFLGAWLLFGLLLGVVVQMVPVPYTAGWLAPVVLCAAAAWELCPAVPRHLRAGHRLPSTGNEGWPADVACARAGLCHARACVITCWALMVAMHATGNDLRIIILLTLVSTARRTLVIGPRLGPVTAVVIGGLAALTAA